MEAGLLGRKAGRGYYEYPQDGRYRSEDPSAREPGGAEGEPVSIVGEGPVAAGLRERADAAGYAVSDGQVATGVRAVAVALRDGRGAPIGSIGIASIRTRMMPERIRELVPLLNEERVLIERHHAPAATAG